MQAMIPKIKDMAKYSVTGRVTDSLPLPTTATPEMYLDFARSDLCRPYRRNRINALSNAKRGLHLHVEVLAHALGLVALPKKERHGFPQKLAFLSRCGLVTPAILQRLNLLRNSVEHEYIIPDLQETQDFLDVVELFLSSSRASRTSFPHQTHFGLRHQGRPGSLPLSLGVRVRLGTAEIQFFPSDSGKRGSLKSITYAPDDADSAWETAERLSVANGDIYYDWVSLLMSGP